MARTKIQAEERKNPAKRNAKNIPQQEGYRSKWLWIGAILLLTFISFYPVIHTGFTTWDDPLYVTESNLIKKLSLENISRMFSTSESVALNYHPITIISLAIDYHFSKLDPSHYHFTNLLIHLLNTILVFFFAYRLSGRKLIAGFFVSMFFAIHPMHVESVAWISERKDVLYAFFFLVALLTYLAYEETQKTKYILVTFLLFLLSVLSKAVAVVFPLVMLLLDFYKGRKITLKVFAEKIPFFIISIVFGLLAVKIQSQQAIASYETFSLFKRICFGFYGFFTYIWKLFLPVHLSSFYPYPIAEGQIAFPVIFFTSTILGMLILVVSVLFFFRKNERMKLLAFGLGFYFVTIVLVLQFISVGQVIMAERYSYIPYIGLLFPIGIWLNDIIQTRPSYKNNMIIILFLIALLFSYLTHDRIKVWKNTETLWTDVIEKYPFPPWVVEPAYTARGKYYAAEKGDMDKALSDYNILLQMKTKNHFIYNNLGNIYGTKGSEAEKAGNQSLADEYYNKSIGYFETSLLLDSVDAGTYVNRATAYVFMKKFELAAADFSKALLSDSGNITLIEKRAYSNFQSGRWKEAISDYDRLISIDTGKSYMFLYRGVARMKREMYREAIEDFNNLILREPQNSNAYYNLAYCQYRLNDIVTSISNLGNARQRGYAADPLNLEALLRAVKK